MREKVILALHVVTLLCVALCGLLQRTMSFWALWAAYAVLVVVAFRGSIVSLRIAVLPPLLFLLWWAPWVAYNFWAFATNDPLYVDSPGTILVVLPFAILIVWPTSVVLGAYSYRFRPVFRRLPRAASS
jgi:hypothetical protein